MPGLLDLFTNMDPVQSQSLLSAGAGMLNASGPSLMPHSLGQVLGQGIGAYQQSQQALQERAQQKALYDLKMRGMQGELDDKDQSRADTLAAQDWMRKYGQGAQGDAPTAGAPTPQQAGAPDIFTQRLAQAQAMRASGNPLLMAQADKLEEAALKFKPKYSTDFRPATGADGKLHNYLLADDGSMKQSDLGVAPNLTEVDLGNRKRFVDKNGITPGTEYTIGQSPDSAAVDRRAAADRAASASTPGGLLPDETVAMMAQQYRAGDTSVMQNLGRGAQGPQNIIRLRNEIARQTVMAGQGGADLAARNAEYFGTRAGQRTAGTRIANVEMASNEAQSLIPLARDASSAVQRSGLLPFGKAQIMFDDQTNDPALRKFAAANNALVNVYSRAIAPSGTPTVADKEHAREMLSTAMDQRSYNAVLDQMQSEISAARAAPKAVRQAFNDGVTGRETHEATPAPRPAATQKFDMLPPATQFDGKRMRADNGTTYRSVGGKWVKE